MPAHRKTSSPNSPCSWLVLFQALRWDARGTGLGTASSKRSALCRHHSSEPAKERPGRREGGSGGARPGRFCPSTRAPGAPPPFAVTAPPGRGSCQPVRPSPESARSAAGCSVRSRPGRRAAPLQPAAETGPSPVPRARPAAGSATSNPSARKADGGALSSPPTQGEGAGEGKAAAVCAGDSRARLLIFPGCFPSRVRSARRPRKEPGKWSRRGRASSVTTHTKAKD
ncbi:uncharacterized protein LOC116530991 [Sapajus apella]|uniref:Uncharacterized protein LOC116530991 n=1 Tax=Sapajus apella TaxID=9515 RepID=A0A6J3FI77_SAPAP|nr:uncharacterized protein LOC116530991 [Sapajus apella]